MIALELLNRVEEDGEGTKWDLIKILGSEVQFTLWVERFFLPENVLVERRGGKHYFYKMTEHGNLFHKLLKNGNRIRLLSRVRERPKITIIYRLEFLESFL